MLPHIQNSEAGRNKYDPVHKSLFELGFTLPEALRATYAQDEALLTEHVIEVTGLDGLYKGAEAGAQDFYGTSRSYLNPHVGDTFVEPTVKFSLNLRNGVDNYIYKLFRAWKNLNYNLETGERGLKSEYTADWMHLMVANRKGDVFHDVVMKDVMLVGDVKLLDGVDHKTDDAVELEIKFRSDWWKELNA